MGIVIKMGRDHVIGKGRRNREEEVGIVERGVVERNVDMGIGRIVGSVVEKEMVRI